MRTLRERPVARRTAALVLACALGVLLGATPAAAAPGLHPDASGEPLASAFTWLQGALSELWAVAPTLFTTEESSDEDGEEEESSGGDPSGGLDPGSPGGVIDPNG